MNPKSYSWSTLDIIKYLIWSVFFPMHNISSFTDVIINLVIYVLRQEKEE